MNLYELYYSLLRDGQDGLAEDFLQRLLPYCEPIKSQDIKDAARLRISQKRKNLSYVDCLGYTIARRMRIRFLTGDKAFSSMDNVLFVK